MDELLKQHTQKHAWINIVCLENPPYTVNYFKKRLKELQKTDVEEQHRLEKKEEKKMEARKGSYMQKIKSDKELFNTSKTIQIFGFLRSYRADVAHVAYYNCWNIELSLYRIYLVARLL